MEEKRSQVYVDPIFIKGNILRAYIWWDWKTRLEVEVEFIDAKTMSMNRFRIIGFMTELMRRSGIDLVMTRNQFINMQFGEFPKLKINIKKMDF